MTDVILYADKILGNRLVQPPQGSDKTAFAADEAVKIKKLVQACRGLWRASSAGNHPRMTELKQIMKPSPQKEKEPKDKVAHLMLHQFTIFWVHSFCCIDDLMQSIEIMRSCGNISCLSFSTPSGTPCGI